RDHLRELGFASPLRPVIEGRQHGQDQQPPEPLRSSKLQAGIYGSRLHIVCENRTSTASSDTPAIRNHGKRSLYCAIFSTSIFVFSSLSISAKTSSSERVPVARKYSPPEMSAICLSVSSSKSTGTFW